MLHECLRSIVSSTHHVAIDIWIIDNATDGGGVAEMRTEFPQVQWIFNERRRGFSANHNQVLRIAEGRYACILNDDVLVHDGAFDKLVGFLDENPRVGMVGPKLLNQDGTIQESTFEHATATSELLDVCLLPRRFVGLKRRYIETAQYGNRPSTVDFVLGACIVIRDVAFREIGLLDEQLAPVGDSEDWDWCYPASKPDGKSPSFRRRRLRISAGSLLMRKPHYRRAGDSICGERAYVIFTSTLVSPRRVASG